MTFPRQFQPGHRAKLGSHHFCEEEILRFARKYDPQPFHTNRQAAEKSFFGGLCASGWHTAAVWMRCQRDYSARLQVQLESEGLGNLEFGPSPGFENLRWLRPVYVGDTITYFNETTSSRASRSRPGWYVVIGQMSGENQHGQKVFEFSGTVFLRYRHEGAR
jgi:acyl dehydratase